MQDRWRLPAEGSLDDGHVLRQGEEARGFHFKAAGQHFVAKGTETTRWYWLLAQVSLPVQRIVSFIESRAQVQIEDPRTGAT